MHRIIIDTDIGSDVDDAMAIALAMKSPEVTIEGITTVYGDVDLRARMTKKMLQLGNKADIPVFAGINQPLLRNRDIWMAGHEGVGILTKEDELQYESKHAVDFIVETVMANPGQITLVPIGPLTNIAASFIREPELARNVKEIVLMGGVTRLGDNADLPDIEHNIVCDPEAASIVFGSGAPIVMVGLDVTLKVIITEEEQLALERTGDPVNLALGRMMGRWFSYVGKRRTFMHDPLTVSLLIDRTLATTKRANVRVAYDHRQKTGETVAVPAEDGNVQVCIDVDPARFLQLLMERLTRC